jgi:uncharacterized protein (TIGR02594 family)
MSKFYVRPKGLNLRSGPGDYYPVLRVLAQGDTVLANEQDGFVLVEAAGVHGWVAKSYLEPLIGPEIPLWLKLAFVERGVAEQPGLFEHNPRIIEYHSATSLKATRDEVPWCSAFACWCMEKAGVKSTRSAAARSWLDWGREVRRPEPGTVVVLKRGDHSWQGHVGFWIGEDASRILVLGGNQGDEVSQAWYSKARVLSYRAP